MQNIIFIVGWVEERNPTPPTIVLDSALVQQIMRWDMAILLRVSLVSTDFQRK